MDVTQLPCQEQAELLEYGYKKLQEQCKDPEQRKTIQVTSIVTLMEYMVEKMCAPNGNKFEKGFLGHLRVILELATDESQNLTDHFTVITKLLCEMYSKMEPNWKFIAIMLVHWLDFAEKMSRSMKAFIFNELKSTAFVHCAQLLINAPCILVSLLTLNILCSYVEADPYPLVSISSLFDGIAGPHIMHLIESIKWQKNGILLNNKFRILERINHMKQSIYSEMIDALKFGAGEKISFKPNDGRLYFNKLTKTIEFCVTYKSNATMITISARKLKKVQVFDSGHCLVNHLKLILDEPPRLENLNGKSIKLTEFKETTIDVKFCIGIYKFRLNSMLMDMFEIVPETLDRPKENEDYDSDCVIVQSPNSSMLRRLTRSIARTTNGKPIQSDTTNTKKTRTKRSSPKKTETKVFNMPTTKRSQREAAKKAVKGIHKSLDDTAYEFIETELPKIDSKRNDKNKPQSPVSKYVGIGSMKRIAEGAVKPRKLWSHDQNQMQLNYESGDDIDDDDKSKKSPTKRRIKTNTDVELTPTGFQKSMYENPKVQISCMLANASRINEDIKRITIESTTSEKTADLSRDIKKMKAQTDDTAGQPTELENTNKNAKRKRCSCQLIEAELINIGKLTRKALAIIHSNEYVCTRCGGTAQRASQ